MSFLKDLRCDGGKINHRYQEAGDPDASPTAGIGGLEAEDVMVLAKLSLLFSQTSCLSCIDASEYNSCLPDEAAISFPVLMLVAQKYFGRLIKL